MSAIFTANRLVDRRAPEPCVARARRDLVAGLAGSIGFGVIAAETLEDFEAFGSVCRAYVEWCRERYQDMPWLAEEVFGYQALDERRPLT